MSDQSARSAIACSNRTLYALECALEKLRLYRAEHGGEYVGGMEYVALTDLLDKEICALRIRSQSACSIPVDLSMIANAKEAEKVGMSRITISVPIKDILYGQPSAPSSTEEIASEQDAVRFFDREVDAVGWREAIRKMYRILKGQSAASAIRRREGECLSCENGQCVTGPHCIAASNPT